MMMGSIWAFALNIFDISTAVQQVQLVSEVNTMAEVFLIMLPMTKTRPLIQRKRQPSSSLKLM